MSRLWDPSTEDAALRCLVASGATSAAASAAMNRGAKSVLKRARELGLKWEARGRAEHFTRLGAMHGSQPFPNAGGKPVPWTEEEDRLLTTLVNEGAGIARIRSVMKRGAESTKRRIAELGLRLHVRTHRRRQAGEVRQYKSLGAPPLSSDAELFQMREQRAREAAYIAQVNAERIRIFSQPYRRSA